MAEDRMETVALESVVSWLEGEVRQSKAQQSLLQQQLEQLQAQIWDLTEKQHKAEDSLTSLSAVLRALPQLNEEVRQLRENLARLSERQTGMQALLEEMARQHQAEGERDRQERSEVVRRLDGVERLAEAWNTHLEVVEQTTARDHESVNFLRLRFETVERSLSDLEGKAARSLENDKRTEQEIGRLHSETEALRKQDEVFVERLQLVTQLASRLEETVGKLQEGERARQEAIEKLDLARAERQRLEERLLGMEQMTEAQREKVEDQGRALSLLDTRNQGQLERMAALQDQVGEYRQQVIEQYVKLLQTLEKLRRRQIDEMEREVRELKQHEIRLAEE